MLKRGKQKFVWWTTTTTTTTIDNNQLAVQNFSDNKTMKVRFGAVEKTPPNQ